jgi:molybdenum cofactor cytidylyltransferase
MMGIAGVILAAGESLRMGRDKALLPWPPRPSHSSKTTKGGAADIIASRTTILSSAISGFVELCDFVVVVAGKNYSALEPVAYSCGAFLVQNPNPERGQFSSFQTGLREVLSRGRDSAMITLVDRPPAHDETLSALMTAFATRDHGVWAIVPEFGGKHGHPILIGRELIEVFLRAAATANAREIEHANQERIRYVAVEDPLVTMNVDTPEDYASLESGSGL